jgi:hypothetical protein
MKAADNYLDMYCMIAKTKNNDNTVVLSDVKKYDEVIIIFLVVIYHKTEFTSKLW